MAQRRRTAAARLAEGGVLELRSRPPETLLCGARVSQEVKCCSLRQRLMSVPISPMSCSAVEGADGIDLSEVGAGQAEEGRADLTARVVVPGFARAPWGGERVRRGRLAFGEGREVRVDRGVAGVD